MGGRARGLHSGQIGRAHSKTESQGSQPGLLRKRIQRKPAPPHFVGGRAIRVVHDRRGRGGPGGKQSAHIDHVPCFVRWQVGSLGRIGAQRNGQGGRIHRALCGVGVRLCSGRIEHFTEQGKLAAVGGREIFSAAVKSQDR